MKLYREAKPLEICDGADVFVKYLVPIEITEEEIIEIFSAIWYTDLHGVTGLEEAITELLSKLKGE